MNVQYHRLTDAGFAYAVRMPERMHAGLPMIIQLHGAGERGGGEELEKVEIHGMANVLTKEREAECVLVEPQCPKGTFWVAMLPELKRFVCRMIEAYACDPDRVTLTGLSMGGYGHGSLRWRRRSCSRLSRLAAAAECRGTQRY